LDCAGCGKPIVTEESKISVGERDLNYHLSCAPDDLLNDAVTEGNAILARGVTYYVNKYLPDQLRAPNWPRAATKMPNDDELARYAEIFSRMVNDYKEERSRRKR